MGSHKDGFADTWRRANDFLLAPFVVIPNLGLAAANAMAGATARLAEQAVKATGGAFGRPGELAESFSGRVADRTLSAARESADFALQAARNAAGGMTGPGSNDLLAQTVLGKAPATAALPIFVGWDALLATFKDMPAMRDNADQAWLRVSAFLDTGSSQGMLSGRERAASDSRMRLGFIQLALKGPIQAVARDFYGIVGGVLALGMGDFEWLAVAAKNYWASMEYVYDKWLAGETEPQSDFPIGALLATEARLIIQRFPGDFVAALETKDPPAVLKALRDNAGEVLTMLSLYPFTAFQVVYDVLVFILKAWLQVADALDYALCELAIVESPISDEAKTFAMERLRKTAGNATVEFEYYVPLLVPFRGTPADQALSRSVTGKIINEHTIAESVFMEEAIQHAQDIDAEVIQLPAFLWLYRDEAVARRKSYHETARKFGPDVADRIERAAREGRSRYPLSGETIAALMRPKGGGESVPRTPQEINEIFSDLLRRRGLLYVSELVAGRQPFDLTKEY